MKDVSFDEFEKAFDYVINNNLLIMSYAKAGKGVKRLEYKPSNGEFIISSKRTGDIEFVIHSEWTMKTAYESYCDIYI